MFIPPASTFIPPGSFECVVPENLNFVVLPATKQRVRCRCGHWMFAAHVLLIEDTGICVADTAATSEPKRRNGIRPLGLLGSILGVSLHRCDKCRRRYELAKTIVCPICEETIPPGYPACIVKRNLALDEIEERSRTFATSIATTVVQEHGGDPMVVVCRRCGIDHFGAGQTLYRWQGEFVVPLSE